MFILIKHEGNEFLVCGLTSVVEVAKAWWCGQYHEVYEAEETDGIENAGFDMTEF